MEFDHDRWCRHRWETDSRYYVAEVTQDLFGTWVVKRSWGSRTTKRGNSLTSEAESYEHALRLLDQIAKRRVHRGYRHV